MKNQHVKDAIQKVVEALRDGNIKEIAYAVFKCQKGRPSDSWSFLNRLVMALSGTDDARGIGQWNRRSSGSIIKRRKKGENKTLYAEQNP